MKASASARDLNFLWMALSDGVRVLFKDSFPDLEDHMESDIPYVA